MNKIIGIIGLGYVGLPLAIEFGKKYKTYGFDINKKRIEDLKLKVDKTNEIETSQFLESNFLEFTSEIEDLKNCDIFIVTVPTPIDSNKNPDLKPLIKASESISKILKKNDIVIYESTVYPGCTEEICIPILEQHSNLTFNTDFFCGYSPERINPGDKVNTLTKIKKVTSGSNSEIAIIVDNLYNSIIEAGTHLAPSIKIAEASKAVENAQRDLNISFVNELSIIFDRIGIDTNDVIEAASTKWNFLKFKPGLVGGHCIGVDPYYLVQKSQSLGYFPEVILSGRRINENMGNFVSDKLIKLLIKNDLIKSNSKVLILGFTFKENCPDTRNTKVIDIYKRLQEFGLNVDIYDPYADKDQVKEEYGIKLIENILDKYEGIILAVPHYEIMKLDIKKLKSNNKSIIFDVKSALPKEISNARL